MRGRAAACQHEGRHHEVLDRRPRHFLGFPQLELRHVHVLLGDLVVLIEQYEHEPHWLQGAGVWVAPSHDTSARSIPAVWAGCDEARSRCRLGRAPNAWPYSFVLFYVL